MADDRHIVPADEEQRFGMITPAGTIEEALEQFRLYQELKTKLATKEDFQRIGDRDHPKKSFVRKVQRFFNISCELIRDEPITDGNGKIIGWIATARAIHLRTGAYQDADGSCSFDEKVEKQRTLHNVRAHAVTRAKNRAILDLVGFGDVSAEEISELDGAPRVNYQRRNGRPQARQQSDAVTREQLQRIGQLVKELGWSADDARTFAQGEYGVSDARQLTREQAEDMIGKLEDLLHGAGDEQPMDVEGTVA